MPIGKGKIYTIFLAAVRPPAPPVLNNVEPNCKIGTVRHPEHKYDTKNYSKADSIFNTAKYFFHMKNRCVINILVEAATQKHKY